MPIFFENNVLVLSYHNFENFLKMETQFEVRRSFVGVKCDIALDKQIDMPFVNYFIAKFFV